MALLEPGEYGHRLARRFQADASHFATTGIAQAKLAVSRVRRATPGHGWVARGMAEEAFTVSLHLIGQARRDLYTRGRLHTRGGLAARTVSIIDHEEDPYAFLASPFDTLHFYVSRAALDEIAEECGARRVDRLGCGPGLQDATLWHLGMAMLPALDRPHEVSTMFAEHLLRCTHTYFAEAFGGMRRPDVGRRGQLAPWQLRRACEVMQRDLSADISAAEPAEACGLSQSYFARAFKASTGEPPHRWLLRQRIEQARTLCATTALSLTQVGLDCGFADQSHFNRVFRRLSGMSPGQWRRAFMR